ncbi:MAG: outer membrane beta-barrel protein [Saprospiraceae bacterium]|nr:outer membrane beta-barrel protein [Saprospiraceae bacterium]
MVTCLLANLPVSSQSENFRLGVQLSPSFNWTNTDDNLINRAGTNLGITIGALGEFYFSEHVSLAGGLALAFGKGGTLQHDIGGNFLVESELSDPIFNTGDKPLPDGVEIKYTLQYLEFPLGMKFRTKEYGYLRFFGEVPILTWGIRMQARGAIDAGPLKAEKENIAKDVNFLNLAWGFGAGAEYALNENTSLQGGLYFQRGLTDMTRDKGRKAMDNPNQQPGDPDDDYIFTREDAKAQLNQLTVRLAILF